MAYTDWTAVGVVFVIVFMIRLYVKGDGNK